MRGASVNRRKVLGAAAGLLLSVRVPRAYAQTYDLVIKGGRVIDPSIGLDGIRDVALSLIHI